jgi:pimeloyl-ACP methyl ester carboxylesterase
MNDRTHFVPTRDGRTLRVVEAGTPDGVPILVHHGTPGSGLFYPPWVSDAEERGIRLLGYDRPGYGSSTPSPGRSVASAADDVVAIAKALGLERLSTWGLSGGGPHALACAALLPNLVVAAAALAPPAPYGSDGLDWFAGMGEENVVEFGSAVGGRDQLERFVESATPDILQATPATIVEAFASLLSPPDAAVFGEDLADYLLNCMRLGISQRRDGWIDDDIAFTTPWGLELSQIRIPVMLMQGAQDKMVPFSHGKWLANRIPAVEARFFPEDGHLTLFAKRISDVHEWLTGRM